MIHINRGDGPHEWLTDEQVREKYPKLWASMHRPRPYAEAGTALRQHRLAKRISMREFAKVLGINVAILSDYEIGRRDPDEIRERYLKAIRTIED